MLLWMKETALPVSAFEKFPAEKTVGKFPIGVLYKGEAKEYSETYFAMVEHLQKKQEGRGD
jgi:2-oxoglutarate ferredoxin oxidoreductase subunit beta